ncbi:MAG: hypothetical protein FWC67_02900 [Defluviitaleaceae bacterium]|nr:hypothetical protein [Defluviitaleaceae bacterium]
MNINNPNYIPSYVPSTKHAAGGPNNNRLTQQEITERQIMREVFSRVDSRLGKAHLAEVARIGGGRVSTMQTSSSVVTQHSEAIRNQTIDIVRDIMSQEEDGTLRMTTLQQMLDNLLNQMPMGPAQSRQWRA